MSSSNVFATTLHVADLERSTRFYTEALSYEVRGEGSADEQGRDIWRVPLDNPARYRLLAAPGSATGLLCLLCCDRPGDSIWGDYSAKQDLGLYAPNWATGDVRRVWARLTGLGARVKFPPTHWTLDGFLAAWDSQCIDPDGVLVDVYELDPGYEELWGSPEGEVSELSTMAVHVRDADTSIAFYRALGLDVVYDHLLPISELLGLPAGAQVRNVNMNNPKWGRQGRVELVQYVGHEGVPIAERAAPPQTGVVSITFATDDLTAQLALAEAAGGRTASVVENWASPYGLARAARLQGPDGEAVELIELSDFAARSRMARR